VAVTPRDVTAVVLNYRTPQRTITCIDSLVAAGVMRIIVVENSADEGRSRGAMDSHLRALSDQGAEILLIDENRNLGFAAGVNRALALARDGHAGPALLLNSDARLTSRDLRGLLDALDDADVVAPRIDSGGVIASPVIHYQRQFALMTNSPVVGSRPYFIGACLLLARHLVKPDLFDEDFFFYGEDVELGVRLQEAGERFRVAVDSVVVHEGAASSRKGSLFYEYHINRGHWLLAAKLADTRLQVLQGYAGRLLTLPLRAVCRSIRLRRPEPLQGMWAALVDVIARRPVRYRAAS